MGRKDDRLLTVNEVAERLNCTVSYVRYLLLEKRLPRIKIGSGRYGAIRIAESDLERFIADGRDRALSN